MDDLPPIPVLMARLKRFKGLPVPFTVFWNDGTPDFRVIDERRKRQCLEGRLCGICGNPIVGTLALIGGDSSITRRVFVDPPMHIICAKWAAKVCPYLSNADARHRLTPVKVEGGTCKPLDIVSTIRPKRMGLYLTDGYTYGRVAGTTDQHVYVQANPPISIDWKLMPETK